MSGTQDENPPPPPPQETQQTPTQQTPHTVSTIKLPILKKGEYDIWAMKIEHYLAHTDYPIWEVIQNGNGPVSVTTDTSGQIKILPPKSAEEIVARERERKARTTLLMAIPEDHLAKFHKMTDAKEMWNAIKSRFGGNDESKKMQKYILKQQFEGFTVSNTDGIHKGYERFQSLLSQLEIHGAGVSTEDANQKFLRSLPSAWLQVSLIMRNKPSMDSLSFDDLYNNLRVFENDVKGSTASSSNLQNVAFVSENTNSTNDVSTANGVSNASGHNSKHEQISSSYSLLASQSSCPQLDHEDLDQVDEYDLEEMDLKWQVAMISMRIKKFYKKTGRKLQTKEDNTGNKDGSRTGKKEESKALVTVDGESVDWTAHSEDDENFAFMASNSSGSDTQLTHESNIEVQPKVWSDAPIIEEYESDSDDEYVSVQTKGLDTPSFANKQVNTPKENVKNQSTHSQIPKVNNKELGNRLTERACFVCGSFSHLIRDCDYHVKLAKQVELNKQNMSKGNGTGERKPTWNNVQRHMTGNKAYLADFQDFNGGPVAFGGSKGYITGKGKIKTGKLDFEDVGFVKELQHFNLFSVSQMCDKKNKVLFTDSEWIKREYSNARTPQQNGVAERKNRTLIEAARTMLADSFLPNTFWAEAVSTACYVLNRVLVTKPHNKTPYELLTGKIPIISYIRPFGCHVTILNTIDHLGKFAGKSDEGFLVGYSLQSKAFRVYNLETKRVEKNLHINFLENNPNVAGKGPNWLFDLDYLTNSMNYHPIRLENQANQHACQQEANQNAGTKDIIVRY
ncbi:ribonuclease H-like domain-containing protein [Tanacetum coccineum]